MSFHASISAYDPAGVAAQPSRWSREPALADMLDDPIVTALMTADRVGRRALEADLGRATAWLLVRHHAQPGGEA